MAFTASSHRSDKPGWSITTATGGRSPTSKGATARSGRPRWNCTRPFSDGSRRTSSPPYEGVEPTAVEFVEVPRIVNLPPEHDQDAPRASLCVGGQGQRVFEVARAVRLRLTGLPHGADEDHRPRIVVEQIEEERGLLKRIGTMGHHDAGQFGVVSEVAADALR